MTPYHQAVEKQASRPQPRPQSRPGGTSTGVAVTPWRDRGLTGGACPPQLGERRWMYAGSGREAPFCISLLMTGATGRAPGSPAFTNVACSQNRLDGLRQDHNDQTVSSSTGHSLHLPHFFNYHPQGIRRHFGPHSRKRGRFFTCPGQVLSQQSCRRKALTAGKPPESGQQQPFRIPASAIST